MERTEVKFIVNDVTSYSFFVGFLKALNPLTYTEEYVKNKIATYLRDTNNGILPARLKTKMDLREFELFLVTSRFYGIKILCNDVFILQYEGA